MWIIQTPVTVAWQNCGEVLFIHAMCNHNQSLGCGFPRKAHPGVGNEECGTIVTSKEAYIDSRKCYCRSVAFCC